MLLIIITITIILIISLSVVGIWFKRNFNYWTQYPQVPSVKGRILSGKLKDFITFKTSFGYHLRTLYEDENYKNEAAVGIYGLYQPSLLIREPELIKSVFIKEFDSFSSRPCRSDVRHDPLGALNLVFAEYPYWREMRLKLSPIFSGAKLRFMYPLMQKVGQNLNDYISQQGNCFKLELKQLFGRYITDTISTSILGTTSNALQNANDIMYLEGRKFTHFNLRRALEFLILFFAPKLNRLLRPRVFYKSTENFMRPFIKSMLKEREEMGTKRNDLIDVFVKIKQDAEAKGENISHCLDGLTAQACVLIGGAFDASTNTIANALLELSKNQEVQKKLREEILQVFRKDKGEICYETLNKMDYLQMVIDETLRLYPVLPVLERLYELPINKTSEFTLQPFYDYKLRNQMPVYVSIFGLHYDPKYWPHPTKFDPERFSPSNKKHLTPMTYMPFGVGPHMCIGSRLGMLKVKIGLSYFLKNHYVRTCKETVVKPEFDPKAIVLKLKGDLFVEVVRDNLFDRKVNK
ncbi:cytochrome P450 6g1-like [Lucilia cuprina]|uniref:cytochrome P450 6g1-like n=1 Tax=Lucilia cuprina TaxID=7375 RepID=UPI001F05CECC|nr:cytochrome P450 6g1-like [Lucilia cuprina]